MVDSNSDLTLIELLKKKYNNQSKLIFLYDHQICSPNDVVINPKKIGNGVYGEIYVAKCEGSTEYKYIIKVQKENTINEAITLEKLQKYNLTPKIYQVIKTENDKLFIIMMDNMGTDVDTFLSETDDLIKLSNNLPKLIAEFNDIMERSFTIIKKFHSVGYTHGDAHLGNFMVSDKINRIVKIIDFRILAE